MSTPVPIRLRVAPTMPNKNVPKPRTSWPDCVLIFHADCYPDGSLRLGVLLEVVGQWPVNEYLITPEVDVEPEIAEYCATHRANVLTGCFTTLTTIPLDRVKRSDHWSGLGYLLRHRGYRGGWAIVSADQARTITSVAEHWSESHDQPGVWSVALRGLGEWTSANGPTRYRKFPDAPRVKVTPVGDHALVRWGSTKKMEVIPNEETPLYPQSGPFVDVLAGTSALAGRPVRDLEQACALFGVAFPTKVRGPIDRLRADAAAINKLYQELLVILREMSIDLSTLVSTGGVATALLRSMELPNAS